MKSAITNDYTVMRSSATDSLSHYWVRAGVYRTTRLRDRVGKVYTTTGLGWERVNGAGSANDLD